MAGAGSGSVDVDSFLDALRFNRFHLTVLVLCTLLTAIDGYELYVVGWVLPKLAEDFGVPRTAITSAMIAQQVGMLLGAFVIPPLADRFGRPRVLLACYGGMMLSALAIVHTHSLVPFAAWRFVAGLCGTAMVPILVTLASETAPQRLRSTMSTITVSGTMIGALLGAAMQAFVLEPFGWRGAFWIAAAMPAVMLPLIWFLLPESLRSMAARNPEDPRIQPLADRMRAAGDAPVSVHAVARGKETRKRALLSDILGPGQLLKTLLMWAVAISSFVFITAGVWKTTIFKDVVGLNWQQVAAINATNTVAGLAGMMLIGYCIDRLGFKLVMTWTFLLAAVGAVMIGVLAPGAGMFVAVFAMAIFQHGGQAGIAAMAAALYPPSHRATGVGWAYGAGRIASIFAPLFGNFVLGEGFDAVGIFALLAVPLASAGIFSFWLMSLPGTPTITRANLKH
ncbi:MFS transporter [Sphingomonas histidinilytica]|uniref:MFS transporter, AAHS family, 4-hydroxybenzoate transporter n=1 Tax=Rhizorhabdus histidinilytica TaxID=439228 RepID=A0A1T5G2H8_9SPHN|nr:MFS transporter [Rhizorhabdus histidinilytica]MBO9378374.1 MFS transporter [Rhizorhabdus histidinilytica]SKC02580.1 MFS transporter, AAHS family, 4-hydroxybenzoate transporter [Rhizorhabdus histidinilytica]